MYTHHHFDRSVIQVVHAVAGIRLREVAAAVVVSDVLEEAKRSLTGRRDARVTPETHHVTYANVNDVDACRST